MDKPMFQIERFKKFVDRFEQEVPDNNFDQSKVNTEQYSKKKIVDCGTACCIAGWSVAFNLRSFNKMTKEYGYVGNRRFFEWYFGFTEEESNIVFYSGFSRKNYSEDITKTDAIKYLRKLIIKKEKQIERYKNKK